MNAAFLSSASLARWFAGSDASAITAGEIQSHYPRASEKSSPHSNVAIVSASLSIHAAAMNCTQILSVICLLCLN